MYGVTRFQQDLERSQETARASWWSSLYRAAFGEHECLVDLTGDKWAQSLAIDRNVVFPYYRQHYIEEKVREQHYSDVLLEVWSSYENRARGWMYAQSAAEYLVYVRRPETNEGFGRATVLPWLLLRAAWAKHGELWMESKRWIPTKTKQGGVYTSWVIAVPQEELLEAVKGRMDVTFYEQEQRNKWSSYPIPRNPPKMNTGRLRSLEHG